MRPAALYVGSTSHKRFAPQPHGFRYRIFQLLVDADRLEEAFAGLRWIKLERFGLMSYRARDHGARDGSPLRTWVEDLLAEAGLECTAARIRLLCFPRVLGFVFNPLSVVFVEDEAGALEAVIYEVNNTFGERHAYVVPGGRRTAAEKRFFVSPFYDVEGEYRFELTPPEERFALRIVKAVDGRPDFIATQSAERRPLTDAAVLKLFLGLPLMTLKVVAAIHWEALRLWLKGTPLKARPKRPKTGWSSGRGAPLPIWKNDGSLILGDRSDHERFRRKRRVRLGNA